MTDLLAKRDPTAMRNDDLYIGALKPMFLKKPDEEEEVLEYGEIHD